MRPERRCTPRRGVGGVPVAQTECSWPAAKEPAPCRATSLALPRLGCSASRRLPATEGDLVDALRADGCPRGQTGQLRRPPPLPRPTHRRHRAPWPHPPSCRWGSQTAIPSLPPCAPAYPALQPVLGAEQWAALAPISVPQQAEGTGEAGAPPAACRVSMLQTARAPLAKFSRKPVLPVPSRPLQACSSRSITSPPSAGAGGGTGIGGAGGSSHASSRRRRGGRCRPQAQPPPLLRMRPPSWGCRQAPSQAQPPARPPALWALPEPSRGTAGWLACHATSPLCGRTAPAWSCRRAAHAPALAQPPLLPPPVD